MSVFEWALGSSEAKTGGVMIGVVTDNNDPDGLGRVKVKLPFKAPPVETDWIRVATLMGGPGRGTLFIPEVDDEVLLVSYQGDFFHPVVIGSLWSDKQKPPQDKTDKENNLRKIRSRAGHEIVFDDSSKGEVSIKTAKGNQIVLNDDKGTLTINNLDGKKIEVAKEGVTVTCEQSTVSLKPSGQIEIKGTNTKIEAQQIEIKGTTLSIKADAQLTVESSGMLTLKGSLVKIN
ncbi:phage tail protein [Heliobacillus mobilis]|uniref:Phage tail protein n=1 Tax=Heliobacterium mobile TaxID=28064 RepID=A0A6I3SMY7_HELMO|nr:phage baseplate assembly protein V [Heliobacterium mobile]MTV50360.1 phage tail protein [Heliobacterium mobile]